MSALTWTQFLMDPRGRANRTGFLIGSAAVMGVEIVGSVLIHIAHVAPDSAIIFALKGLMVWMTLVVIVKRLHDLGFSAFWLAGGIAVMAAWVAIFVSGFIAIAGFDGIAPDTMGFLLLNAGAVAPALALLLWLQMARGNDRANLFGALPSQFGYSLPELTDAAAPTLAARTQH